MDKSINLIISEHDDLHVITIKKPTRDRSTWTFKVTDKTSRLNGVCDKLSNYNYKIITLQRGEHFFVTYKFIFDDGFEYLIDPKKSIHRSSVKKYLENMMNYIVWSNDISYFKNDPSFKYTKMEMSHDDVSNYLDLCVRFGDYSSIGTGITRVVRNLIVLDVDVNCENPENKKELDELIIKFSEYDFTPNFYIINHESKHVQLQWLIKDCNYKDINWKHVHEKIKYFESTKDKYKEIGLHDFNFTELSEEGIKYRRFTRGLTKLSDKRKFGDEHFTFWKAKNFYTALLGKYNLELKIPKVMNGEITYLSQTEMEKLFSSKESRKHYFNLSPTMDEIYSKTEKLMEKHMSSISDKTILEIDDDNDNDTCESFELYDFTNKNHDISRNSFVLNTTRTCTWEVMRDSNFKDKHDVYNMSQKNQKTFKNKIKKIVKSKFEQEDKKYYGDWPGTTNHSKYTAGEFNLTFDSSYHFAVEHFKNNCYDDGDRDKSYGERLLKKQLRQVLIIYLKGVYGNIKKTKLFEYMNKTLVESNHKKVSIATFKRDMREIESYSTDDMENLFTHVLKHIDERKQNYISICENTNDKKEINIAKKQLNRLWLDNLNEVRNMWKQ